MTETKTVSDTLAERGARYGEFADHAHISQALKNILFDAKPRHALGDDMVEALEMIAHKLARICNGDPTYSDSWTDIAGYAELVAARLRRIELDRLVSRASSEESNT
jgi:hypothetical protein